MLIEYIGKEPIQIDRLGNTGLVWRGPGAVVEVEDAKEAARFLSHPDVWVEAKPQAKSEAKDEVQLETPVEVSDAPAEPVETAAENRPVAKPQAKRKR